MISNHPRIHIPATIGADIFVDVEVYIYTRTQSWSHKVAYRDTWWLQELNVRPHMPSVSMQHETTGNGDSPKTSEL